MSEFNYNGRYTLPANEITQATRSVLQLEGAEETDSQDIMAGRVDDAVVDYIRAKKTEVEQQQRELGMGGIPYRVYANALLFSSDGEFLFGEDAMQLRDDLTDEEASRVFPVLEGTMQKDRGISRLFPGDFGTIKPEQAYGESVTKILPVLLALKRGEKLPTHLPLNGGGATVSVDTYSLDDAVHILADFNEAIGRMVWLNAGVPHSFLAQTTNRVFEADNFAIFRVMEDKNPSSQILMAARLKAGRSYDPRVEYANKKGTQQSIGFTVDMGKDYVSPIKSEQVNPICIRIDNEGDKIALDIGSILGKKGTLGKGIADLIALGDYLHAQRTGVGLKLNHSDYPFLGTDFHNEDVFGRAVAAKLEMYEASATRDLPKVLARAGKVGESLLQSVGSQ